MSPSLQLLLFSHRSFSLQSLSYRCAVLSSFQFLSHKNAPTTPTQHHREQKAASTMGDNNNVINLFDNSDENPPSPPAERSPYDEMEARLNANGRNVRIIEPSGRSLYTHNSTTLTLSEMLLLQRTVYGVEAIHTTRRTMKELFPEQDWTSFGSAGPPTFDMKLKAKTYNNTLKSSLEEFGGKRGHKMASDFASNAAKLMEDQLASEGQPYFCGSVSSQSVVIGSLTKNSGK
jgi:hypothetical protein